MKENKNIKIKKNINKAALITGGAKRIGKAIALKLAELKYDLVINYNNSQNEAKELVNFIENKYGVKVAIFKADLTKQKEVEKMIDFMLQNYSNWSLLINNASIFDHSKFIEESDQLIFDNNLAVHLLAPIYLIKEFTKIVLRNKVKDAQIINILDKNICRHETINFYYLLTKKFLASATEMIALQIAPHIRINGISPGIILPKNEEKKFNNIIPLKKIGNVKNITDTIEFLLKNNFITGQIIAIDGGASLNHAG